MTTFDISATTAPRSDQQNFDDYIAGPKTVTITEARAGTAEQPVELHLAEFPGRPYKPSKTQRRVLVAAWGSDAGTYGGRRMTLYGDPSVKFGGVTTGGIKISHLSHIDKPLNLSLTETRGKRVRHTVQPLVEAAPDTALPRLYELMSAAGFTKENAADRLTRIVGRPVKGSKDLTADEVTAATVALETGWTDAPTLPIEDPPACSEDVRQPPADPS